MGRTNGTYRQHLDEFLNCLRPFRKALRAENRESFDNLKESAYSFAHAGSYLNYRNPRLPALLSMILGNRKKLMNLRKGWKNLRKDSYPNFDRSFSPHGTISLKSFSGFVER